MFQVFSVLPCPSINQPLFPPLCIQIQNQKRNETSKSILFLRASQKYGVLINKLQHIIAPYSSFMHGWYLQPCPQAFPLSSFQPLAVVYCKQSQTEGLSCTTGIHAHSYHGNRRTNQFTQTRNDLFAFSRSSLICNTNKQVLTYGCEYLEFCLQSFGGKTSIVYHHCDVTGIQRESAEVC